VKDLLYKYRWFPGLLLFITCLWAPAQGSKGLGLGLIILFLGQLLRVWSRMYIGEHSRGYKKQAPQLVQSGPYSLSQNPLYVSNIIVGTGLLLIATGPSIVFGAGLIFVISFYFVLAKAEAEFLAIQFKEEYVFWSQKTPTWFGFKFKPILHSPQRSFAQALYADSTTWIIQYIIVSLFITLRFEVLF
jgi:protein-S-isoprenylcysteine O-methyltransferase Ste14